MLEEVSTCEETNIRMKQIIIVEAAALLNIVRWGYDEQAFMWVSKWTPIRSNKPVSANIDRLTEFNANNINNTCNLHRWSEENPHAFVEAHFRELFSVNVWCGIIDNQLLGPVILPHFLTERHYLYFLEEELLALLEDIGFKDKYVLSAWWGFS